MYSKVTLGLLLLVLIAVGRGAWDIHQKAVIEVTERDITARALTDLQTRTSELQKSLVDLKSEQGIEATVRQKYTVARTGEEVVVVVDDNEKKGKNGDAVEQKSLWQHFVSFFKN